MKEQIRIYFRGIPSMRLIHELIFVLTSTGHKIVLVNGNGDEKLRKSFSKWEVSGSEKLVGTPAEYKDVLYIPYEMVSNMGKASLDMLCEKSMADVLICEFGFDNENEEVFMAPYITVVNLTEDREIISALERMNIRCSQYGFVVYNDFVDFNGAVGMIKRFREEYTTRFVRWQEVRIRYSKKDRIAELKWEYTDILQKPDISITRKNLIDDIFWTVEKGKGVRTA